MIAMLALSACGKKADSESSIPEEVSNQLPVQAESLLNQLYKMDDAELDQVIESVEQNGQTAFAEGVKNFKSTKELVGDLVGIAACDIDIKALGAVSISGVYDITKKTGEAIEAGKLVYYSVDGVTATAGSNSRVGYTVAKALAGDSTVRVRLG